MSSPIYQISFHQPFTARQEFSVTAGDGGFKKFWALLVGQFATQLEPWRSEQVASGQAKSALKRLPSTRSKRRTETAALASLGRAPLNSTASSGRSFAFTTPPSPGE